MSQGLKFSEEVKCIFLLCSLPSSWDYLLGTYYKTIVCSPYTKKSWAKICVNQNSISTNRSTTSIGRSAWFSMSAPSSPLRESNGTTQAAAPPRISYTATAAATSNPELDLQKLQSLPAEQQDLFLLNFVSSLSKHYCMSFCTFGWIAP